MSTSAINYVSNDLNDLFDRDENGLAIMPDNLVKYEAGLVRKLTADEINSEALRVWNLWEAAEFEQVELTDRYSETRMMDCHRFPTYFDYDYPVEEDFSTEQEFDIARSETHVQMATAKKLCDDCPLRAQCLARSLTIPAYSYGGNTVENRKLDELKMEEYGISGGWGPRTRRRIFNRLLEIWGASGRGPEELHTQKTQDSLADDLISFGQN